MIWSDRQIKHFSLQYDMIKPFVDKQVEESVISYGLSSYGYDIRLSDEFKIFTNVWGSIVDPKKFPKEAFVEQSGQPYCMIPPNSFALGRSFEYFKIPRHCLAICLGKSTYARCGIVVNVTPLEPEWEGFITIEISNTTPLPCKVYAFEGIAQILFLGGAGACEQSYADKKGKYQNQQGIVLPKVKVT